MLAPGWQSRTTKTTTDNIVLVEESLIAKLLQNCSPLAQFLWIEVERVCVLQPDDIVTTLAANKKPFSSLNRENFSSSANLSQKCTDKTSNSKRTQTQCSRKVLQQMTIRHRILVLVWYSLCQVMLTNYSNIHYNRYLRYIFYLSILSLFVLCV